MRWMRRHAGSATRLRLNLLRGILTSVCIIGISILPASEARETASFGMVPMSRTTDVGVMTEATLFGVVDPRIQPYQLSESDIRSYKRIFDLQADGKWIAADREMLALTDHRLLGHVLFQRYMHPTAYRSRFDELRSWLDLYADHPGAERIHALALQRMPAGARPPRKPVRASEIRGSVETYGFDATGRVLPRRRDRERPLSEAARAELDQASQRIAKALRAGDTGSALALLESDEIVGLFDPLEYDAAKVGIATRDFFSGNNRRALALAGAAAARSGDAMPVSHWIAGLAAWRLKQFDRAGRHFEALASAKSVSSWDVAAGAYWAARVHRQANRSDRAERWLKVAARHPRTFYGLIARRTLGIESTFDWRVPELTPDHIRVLADLPAGRRAIALLQVGRQDLAEQELQRLHPQGDAMIQEALVALVDTVGLPALALKIGNAFTTLDGAYYDAALYPLPPWAPQDGFSVDRALLYALMRQESRFDPSARSYAGASGLMQLMPATAKYMGDGEDFAGQGPERLFEPEFNVTLGQRYVAYLLDHPWIERNLFLMVTAYNGGPGNMQKWRRAIQAEDDPLLFIESLPSRETRNFVERVLANYWIYRQRLDQDTPSLDAIAAGEWPVYMPLDEPKQASVTDAADTQVAENGGY